MKRTPEQREHGLTESFALGGMRVNERADVFGQRFPGDGELSFSDEFTSPVTDDVHTRDWPVDSRADDFDAA